MRHATAGSGGGGDHERTLTARGRDEGKRVGLSLRAHGPIPERILCSSAIRCRETWQAVCSGLGASPSIDFDDDLYNASSTALLRCLTAVADDGNVLLLAHNPGVSLLALELARGDDEGTAILRAGFGPATIACFEIEGPWSGISAGSTRLTRFKKASSA